VVVVKKCECGAGLRLKNCCREPAMPNQLRIWFGHVKAGTETQGYGMDAIYMDHSEGCGSHLGIQTDIPRMPELDYQP
jgi:hypothetical protein